MSVRSRWIEAVERLGGSVEVAEKAARDLENRYNEPHRRYHDLAHAHSVARHADRLARALSTEDRALITLAACAHDVIYDAKPGDDERRSAEWARDWLTRAGLVARHVARVEELILTTLSHDAPAEDQGATALLDADLATLGASEDVYDQYARDVREEFKHVDDQAWTVGRAAVLEKLLAKDPLFRSPAARAEWDAAARANLTRELTRWRRPATDLG
ncbi:Predicted metal-dependent phosphohydrolase, HD superfamily [Amycolatopsis xylanica]|uniref:Predicted metal-dependent phosphohydrolase, HD superfamily n=1 Tax=Amycolatopsis xylanica TaxID=589385 RepID=A0A1H3IUJ9_9PSEU|nr:hypothetical protein [Amycolatopsis xylanica]SDY31227.1 Predicted metal-dependent phosphohydrolase, HD superfamily [Amycolatopsis xylanica]